MSSSVLYAVALIVVASFVVKLSGAVLSDQEKYEILTAHNLYRSKVTPTSSDMVALVS